MDRCVFDYIRMYLNCKMNMKYLIALLSFLSLQAVSFAQNSEQDVINKINVEAMKLTSMQCDFVQVKHVKLLNDKMVSKGKMAYKQTDKLRWEYTTPYTYTFILNGNKIVLKKNQKSNVIDVNQSKMFKEIANIMMNSVVGKCLSDKKSFRTFIKASSSEYEATLIPLTKEIRHLFSKIILHFDKQQLMIKKVEMLEKNGDTTIITLSNIKKNSTINDQVFSLH